MCFLLTYTERSNIVVLSIIVMWRISISRLIQILTHGHNLNRPHLTRLCVGLVSGFHHSLLQDETNISSDNLSTCLPQPLRSDSTEIEVRHRFVNHRFTIPQHSCKKFCTGGSNLIADEIELRQRSALWHHSLQDITLRENSFGFVILLFINQIILFPTDYPHWRGPEVLRCEVC